MDSDTKNARPEADAESPAKVPDDFGIEITIEDDWESINSIAHYVRQTDPKLMIVQRESPGKITWQIKRL